MRHQQTAWDELSEILGEDHSKRFMQMFGGMRVYIMQPDAKLESTSASPSLAVQSMLDAAGPDVANRVRRLLGGLAVYVPMDMTTRNEKINAMRAAGAKIRSISREYGLSERHISHLRRGAA